MRLSPTTGALMPERGFSRRRSPMIPLETYQSHDGVLVTSQLADMYLPGTNDTEVGPTWLLSVSHRGDRPADDILHRVIDCFDMPAYDEDNHYPGITRAVFCPLDETYRTACDCKLTETVIVDPDDGYTWTNPVDGPCRGCELDEMMRRVGGERRPCPIHGDAVH